MPPIALCPSDLVMISKERQRPATKVEKLFHKGRRMTILRSVMAANSERPVIVSSGEEATIRVGGMEANFWVEKDRTGRETVEVRSGLQGAKTPAGVALGEDAPFYPFSFERKTETDRLDPQMARICFPRGIVVRILPIPGLKK